MPERTSKKSAKVAKKAGAKAKPAAREAKPRSHEQATGKAASRLIDQRIRELGGWRGETLARMRALILEAEPEAIEEWKWMGTPVWSRHGIICTGESYTKAVKLTFARGAKVADPSRLFNASLEGNARRAIDIHEGEQVDAALSDPLPDFGLGIQVVGFLAQVEAGVGRELWPQRFDRLQQ